MITHWNLSCDLEFSGPREERLKLCIWRVSLNAELPSWIQVRGKAAEVCDHQEPTFDSHTMPGVG